MGDAILIDRALVRWLANGRKRGISSNTIVWHLTGIETLEDWEPDVPYDPDDLHRCRLLLEAVPTLRADFPRMATLSPQWAALVEAWDELCALMDQESPEWRRGRGRAPKTYARMKQILRR